MTTQDKENPAIPAIKAKNEVSNQNKAENKAAAAEDAPKAKIQGKPVKAKAQKPLKKKSVKSSAKPKAKTSTVKKPANTKEITKEMENIMNQNKAQFDNFTKDASAMSREGTEAFMKSGAIFAKGFEELIRVSMTIAQDAAERQAQFVKEAMSSKTLNEWAEVQSKIVQTNFDDFMSGATKISELSVKVLTDGTAPLNEQANKAIIKAKDAIAA